MNCKPGQLAFIKKAIRQENIGKIVTTATHLGFFQCGEPFVYNGERWLSQDTDDMWVITCPSGIETMYGKSVEAVCPDSWLTPIDPDILDSDHDVKTKDLETV